MWLETDTSFWPDLGLALASLYPDSARDPAGDLWRYLVTNKVTGGVFSRVGKSLNLAVVY